VSSTHFRSTDAMMGVGYTATQRIIPPTPFQKVMWGVLHIGGAWAWAR
jgi:hypothetical protein